MSPFGLSKTPLPCFLSSLKVPSYLVPSGSVNIPEQTTALKNSVEEVSQGTLISKLRHLMAFNGALFFCNRNKANNLRDWLRVVADSKTSYQLKYFNINQDDEEEEE